MKKQVKKVMKPGEMFNKFQMKKKNWIAGAIKKPGALHKELGVAQGKKIPASKLAKATKKGGKEGKRARLAETLKSFSKKKKLRSPKAVVKSEQNASHQFTKSKKKKKIGDMVGKAIGGAGKVGSLLGNMGKAFGKAIIGQDDYTQQLRNESNARKMGGTSGKWKKGKKKRTKNNDNDADDK